jgi:hypothetical protein
MKLLTATTTTQGQRRSDFTFAIEGELVRLGEICDRDWTNGPDGGCGCGRAFGGLNSHKATTTVMVRDVDGFSFEDYAEAFRSYWKQAGWASLATSPADADREAEGLAAELAEIAVRYPVGTVLERRLDEICERTVSA